MESAIFIIITVCNVSMNTLPPGSGRPLRKKRADRYKKPLRFLDHAL